MLLAAAVTASTARATSAQVIANTAKATSAQVTARIITRLKAKRFKNKKRR